MEESVLPWYEQAVWLAVIFIGALVVSFLFYAGLKKVLSARNSEFTDDLRKIKVPFVFMVVVMALQLWPHFYFDSETPFISQLSQIVNILAVTWLLISTTRGFSGYVIRKYEESKTTDDLKLRKLFTQVRLFERIIIVVLIIIAIALILMTFDSIKRLGYSILTSAGIAGIIIGLAAQKLIANLLAGLQLAITQPIRLGDVVIVEGEWGKIHEMTLTYVTVAIWDKRMLVVPSTYFIEKPFQNWTRTRADILGTVFLYVDYRMEVDKIRERLDEIVKGSDFWDGEVANVQVTGATDRTMEVRALVSARNADSAWSLRVHVREKLIAFLQESYPDMLPKSRVVLEREKE